MGVVLRPRERSVLMFDWILPLLLALLTGAGEGTIPPEGGVGGYATGAISGDG